MKNRIKGHRKVKAGELVKHPLNWRRHPDGQKKALKAMLEEVGFARSVTAFERADGKLQLIDGHLRQEESDPEELIDVEVLDVTEEEANKLLLSLDPIAMLATPDQEVRKQLFDSVDAKTREAKEALKRLMPHSSKPVQPKARQYHIIIDCDSEEQQLELLTQFQDMGLKTRAVIA